MEPYRKEEVESARTEPPSIDSSGIGSPGIDSSGTYSPGVGSPTLDSSGMRPLRIVQVAPDFYPVPPKTYGGIERVIDVLVEDLVRKGHEVFLYACKGSQSSATVIPYEHRGSNPDSIAEFVMRTLPVGIDVIHDHTHLSVIGKKLLDTPTICSIHDNLNHAVRNPIYVSQRALQVIGGGEGFYAYNGINVEDYDFSEEKADYLLFLGVVNWHKGVNFALDVAEQTGHRLIIAGPIFNLPFYEENIAPRIRANPKLTYIGEVGGQQRINLLKHAKCMLFPISWEEPFGLVMVEAMACGTPVLGLANGAVPEVLSGFPELICHSVEEMTDKIRLSNFPDAKLMRDYVAHRFSASAMADAYLKIYREVVQQAAVQQPSGQGGRGANAPREAAIPTVAKDAHSAPATPDVQAQLDRAHHLKQSHLHHEALEAYKRVIGAQAATVDMKLAACEQAADMFYTSGRQDEEREFALKSLQFDTPRAEFCCRLGYQFLQRDRVPQAIFWYKLATELERPTVPPALYYEACWTWLPHIQLCICYHRLGDLEKSYEHNELARVFCPDNADIQNNKVLLEGLLREKLGAPPSNVVTAVLPNSMGGKFQMALTLPGYLEETLIKRQSWEPHLSRILSRYAKRGSTFLDIGANIGSHSLYVASEHPDVTCLSFEPHPVIYQQLKRNVEMNKLPNLISFELAVGDAARSTAFHMQDEHSYNRGMSAIEYYDLIGTNYHDVSVEVTSLDEFLEPAVKENVSVMKVDTQGYEFQVLQGARDVIRESKPVITLEHHIYAGASLSAILSLLPDYEVFKLQPWTGEIQPLAGHDPKDFLYDYVCLPPGAVNLLN